VVSERCRQPKSAAVRVNVVNSVLGIPLKNTLEKKKDQNSTNSKQCTKHAEGILCPTAANESELTFASTARI
jgi:hypothetical protein